MRQLVKKNLADAWKDCIEQDYCQKRINSERSLQASFWSHLYRKLPENRLVFVEPTLVMNDRKIRPDFVICNSRNIIAIVELKYLPRGKPSFWKDLENFSLLYQSGLNEPLQHMRYRGVAKDSRKYGLPGSVLFAWASIHPWKKKTARYLYGDDYGIPRPQYLQLEAETRDDDSPICWVNRKEIKIKCDGDTR